MAQQSPDLAPDQADTPAEDRVHHHARVDDEKPLDGKIVTLCGLTLPGPRPEAARLPCCPMCALTMGKACR